MIENEQVEEEKEGVYVQMLLYSSIVTKQRNRI
jgi:hypothetical protein